MASVNPLPAPIVAQITTYLTGREAVSVFLCNKASRELMKNEANWKAFFQREFSFDTTSGENWYEKYKDRIQIERNFQNGRCQRTARMTFPRPLIDMAISCDFVGLAFLDQMKIIRFKDLATQDIPISAEKIISDPNQVNHFVVLERAAGSPATSSITELDCETGRATSILKMDDSFTDMIIDRQRIFVSTLRDGKLASICRTTKKALATHTWNTTVATYQVCANDASIVLVPNCIDWGKSPVRILDKNTLEETSCFSLASFYVERDISSHFIVFQDSIYCREPLPGTYFNSKSIIQIKFPKNGKSCEKIIHSVNIYIDCLRLVENRLIGWGRTEPNPYAAQCVKTSQVNTMALSQSISTRLSFPKLGSFEHNHKQAAVVNYDASGFTVNVDILDFTKPPSKDKDDEKIVN